TQRHREFSVSPCLCGLSGITNPPNPISTVVGNQHGSIWSNSHTDRTAPLRIRHRIDDEAAKEVLNRAEFATLKWNKDDLCAVGRRAIPRSVQRHEQAIPIPLRELRAGIESDAERSGVCRNQNIGYDCALHEIGLALGYARVDVSARVTVGPTIE